MSQQLVNDYRQGVTAFKDAGSALGEHSSRLHSVYVTGIPLISTPTEDGKINKKNLKFHQEVEALLKNMDGASRTMR
jgi:hypothetical protein